jgi:hypothetical protein
MHKLKLLLLGCNKAKPSSFLYVKQKPEAKCLNVHCHRDPINNVTMAMKNLNEETSTVPCLATPKRIQLNDGTWSNMFQGSVTDAQRRKEGQ